MGGVKYYIDSLAKGYMGEFNLEVGDLNFEDTNSCPLPQDKMSLAGLELSTSSVRSIHLPVDKRSALPLQNECW